MMKLDTAWGFPTQLLACENCNWSFLVHTEATHSKCPNCFQPKIHALDDPSELISYPPEQLIPFSVSNAVLQTGLERFEKAIPYPSRDLTRHTLTQRLERIYIPKWLVDCDVEATWQAETGFNYEVVSHQEEYQSGNWRTKEITKTQIRWELRVGTLKRHYANIAAPALTAFSHLKNVLGAYREGESVGYEPEHARRAAIRLPDRTREDAWPEAIPPLMDAGAAECQTAAQADHIRDFRWEAGYTNQNWTQRLLPMYATYYLDDDNNVCGVWINGQTGQIKGVRRASQKRAMTTALWMVGIGVGLFLASLIIFVLGALFPLFPVFGALGMIISFVVGAGALVPIFRAWQFNKRDRSSIE